MAGDPLRPAVSGSLPARPCGAWGGGLPCADGIGGWGVCTPHPRASPLNMASRTRQTHTGHQPAGHAQSAPALCGHCSATPGPGCSRGGSFLPEKGLRGALGPQAWRGLSGGRASGFCFRLGRPGWRSGDGPWPGQGPPPWEGHAIHQCHGHGDPSYTVFTNDSRIRLCDSELFV